MMVKIQAYLEDGKLKIRLSSHVTMDPMIQNTTRKTTTPAKIVRNGGPWRPSLVAAPSDFPLRGP